MSTKPEQERGTVQASVGPSRLTIPQTLMLADALYDGFADVSRRELLTARTLQNKGLGLLKDSKFIISDEGVQRILRRPNTKLQ